MHVGAMALAFAYTLYECWLCLHLDSLSLSHIYVLLNCAMTSPCLVSFNSIASPRHALLIKKRKRNVIVLQTAPGHSQSLLKDGH